jgi:excisionase family DNA binding protein
MSAVEQKRNQSTIVADRRPQVDQNSAAGVASEPGLRRLLPVAAAAEYLGVSRATVERLVRRGELPVVKIGGSTRYDVGDLDSYIDINRSRNRTRTV